MLKGGKGLASVFQRRIEASEAICMLKGGKGLNSVGISAKDRGGMTLVLCSKF